MLERLFQRADIPIAAFLAAIGFGFAIYLYSNPVGTPIFGVGSGSLPTLLAMLIGVLSCLLLLQSAFRPATPAHPVPDEDDALKGKIRLLGLLVLCIAFVASMRTFGYLLSGGAFVLGTLLLFGNRRYFVIAFIVVLTPLLIAQFFERFMVIYLPSGQIF